MASRERLYTPHRYNADTLSGIIKARNHKPEHQYTPTLRNTRTLPKFQKVYSQSRLSRATSVEQPKKDYQRNRRMVYGRLFNELKEIKETLKQSLVNVSQPKKKKSVKRKQKVVTQISDFGDLLGRSSSGNKNGRNYYDVLKHIDEIKYRNKVVKTQKAETQPTKSEEQKILFYGVDYIDNIEFKVKIKLSKTTYYLFAKNNHAKIMIEMSYAEYMKLNLSELKGNPCNILQFLKIDNNKVKFKLKLGSEKRRFYTFKSFLSYY